MTKESFLAENEKKTITLSSFLLVRSMGLAPQPYGRRRFVRLFFAPLTRLLSRLGLKTAHRAVFFTSRSSPLLPCKKNNLHDECASYFFGAVDGTCSATLRAQAF